MKAFRAMMAELVKGGLHPLTPWWEAEAERFFASGARSWVCRVGRGGTKSTFAVMFALRQLLFGEWPVPPGERHFFPFVSIDRGEAALRLRLLEASLQILGVPFNRTGEMIELGGEYDRLAFRVLTCSVAGTSGPRSIGFVADELAKWRSADDSANPAREVVASARAMTVTHPGAKELLISSPWSVVDYHHELVSAGDGPSQIVSIAPTWVANPAISEARTHELERDPRVWAREYLAEPSDAVSAAFDSADVEAAFRAPPDGSAPDGEPVLVLDPSSLRGDPFAVGRFRWHTVGASRVLVVEELATFEVGSGMRADDIGETLIGYARQHGIRRVYSDQREAFTWRRVFERAGLAFTEMTWTSASKTKAIERLRGLMRDRQIIVSTPSGERPAWIDRLRRELAAFEVRATPSGSFTFSARQGHHDDLVATLVTTAAADLFGLLPSSPMTSKRSTVSVRLIN